MFRLLVLVACVGTLTQAAPQAYGVPRLDGKIVGGEAVSIQEYPYQVSLQYAYWHTCGAVIISEDYVLTAAHCASGSTNGYGIRAGSTTQNSGGVFIQIAAIYPHPNYNSSTLDNDFNILRLASSLTFGPTIAPVNLPELNQPIIPGSISKISGWGGISEGSVATTELRAVEVPIVDLEECRAAYGASFVTDRMVCAGFPEGGKDACQGDSGGPLVVNGTLIGLVSWGQGCARPNYPGVYSSVPALRDYITEITGL